MNPIVLNEKSIWLWLFRKVNDRYTDPKNLCHLVRSVVLKCTMLLGGALFLSGFALMILYFLIADVVGSIASYFFHHVYAWWNDDVQGVGMVCWFLIAIFVFVMIIAKERDRAKERARDRRFERENDPNYVPPQPNVLWAYILAVKGKFCPMIEVNYIDPKNDPMYYEKERERRWEEEIAKREAEAKAEEAAGEGREVPKTE